MQYAIFVDGFRFNDMTFETYELAQSWFDDNTVRIFRQCEYKAYIGQVK